MTNCGTRNGYYAHRRLGDQACEECKAAKRDYEKAWNTANPEKVAKKRKTWKDKNHEKVSTYMKDYFQNNPEMVRNAARKRRALALSNGHEPYTEAQVLDAYGTDCHICNKPVDLSAPRSTKQVGWENGLHFDHLLPLSKGGSDSIGNVRPSHGVCNLRKHAAVRD